MSDGDFPAIDGNALGEMCGVNIDRATISYLLGSVKWLASLERYYGDEEDIYETTQAFEQLARRLMAVTNESECVEFVTIPTATIQAYMGTDTPTGWLKCNGAEYDQIDYPALVAKLPASLRDDVAGTFTVPDMRGKMPVGVDTTNFPLASTGGEIEHALSIDELPSHTHLQDAHTHVQNSHNHGQNTHNHSISLRSGASAFGSGLPARSNDSGTLSSVNTGGGTASLIATTPTNQDTTAVNQDTGNDLAHNNMPPYFALNWIIKT